MDVIIRLHDLASEVEASGLMETRLLCQPYVVRECS